MEIEVRSAAHIREFLGNKSFIYSFDGELTVNDLLERLDAQYGLGQFIYNEDKSVTDDVRILLRGRDIRFLPEDELNLRDGDIVLLMPRLAGG